MGVKDTAKEGGAYALLVFISSLLFKVGQEDITAFIQENLNSLTDINLDNEWTVWLFAIITISLSTSIPYHYRLNRMVKQYKSTGVGESVARFEGRLETFNEVQTAQLDKLRVTLEKMIYEQENLREKISVIEQKNQEKKGQAK